MDKSQKLGRIEALDYLRGYFIIVIVIDHVYRWPSLLALITGQGQLWSNAADGFLIISGLLVGYIRGFKERAKPLQDVAAKLFKRALMLYGWSVLLTLLFYALYWSFSYQALLPDAETARGDWLRLIIDSLTLEQAHTWIYYLHLYAIFMAAAIIILWLLRHHLAWVAVLASLAGLVLGTQLGSEWLQKQPLFLLPAVAGYYLEDIQHWVISLRERALAVLKVSIFSLFCFSLLVSVVWAFAPELLNTSVTQAINTLFTRTPISLGTLLIAFAWFIGLFAVFQALLPFIKKYLGWLVLPFGTRSLAAYIIHPVPILFFSLFLPLGQNIWVNTLIGLISILAVWALLRVPLLQKILPR